jgi:3-deoxy-D-manno-octulosonic-acid transferase
MGLLSTLYKYASIAYVGGGYTKDGIHNILEAAVYGKPVVFGPNYKKYREAIQLINCEGAFSFSTEEELLQLVTTLLQNKEVYNRSSQASAKYVADHIGATGKLMAYIQEKRLLIN